MKSTEYLFGQKPSRYPEQQALAVRKIEDATALLRKLAKNKYTATTAEEQEAMYTRYQDVEKSIKWWKDILQEANEEE